MAKAYIQQTYPQVASELVRVQRELQELIQSASDPISEERTRSRRENLERRRAQLLDSFGRLGLAWLMQDGTINLVSPVAPAGDPPTPKDGE